MVDSNREEQIRVSVAMAVFNGERYMREQIDSILCQLEDNDELVISDDGSTDSSLQILQEYQKNDSRIRLIKGPGKGIKKNFEHAITLTRGQYIFLADQDDIWHKNKVDDVLNTFKEQDVCLVVHDSKVFEGEDTGNITVESFFDYRGSKAGVLKNIIKNSYIGCCMAFRRSVKEIILPIPPKIEMHDQWIGVLSDYAFGKSAFLREPLLLYRRHGENSSSMQHYGIGKMLRNRIVFFGYFLVRIPHICQKKRRISRKFKKNDD